MHFAQMPFCWLMVRHGSKLIDHGKREHPYDERNIRPRASSTRERTPATRLRDRDGKNWSSERLKQKDDHHPRAIPSEISASAQYDRTPRKDKHASPKQLSEKSPSCDQRFSGRLSGGRSLDNKGERINLTKYRDRDGDSSLEWSLHQDQTPAKVPFREPTPSGSSMSRGGHFSGVSPNHPLPPPVRQRTEDSSFVGSHDDDRRPQSGDRRFHGHQKRNDMNSGRGHGHSWNNPPNWPPPIANGFVPIQHGAPGFHPPVHQFHAPHMFNLRSQMKLNQPGVSYPMHDAHMRPFGWANPLDESCPPHLWNGGNVFPGEHYMYGRQEWDQNRTHTGSRGWEMAGDVSKGLNEVPDGELPVAKEPDSTAATISESAGGEHNPQPWIEQKEIEHLTPESFEAKDGIKSLESSPGATLNTSMLSKNGAVFSKSYLSRISVSPVLAESELYNKCISLLGDLGVAKAPQMSKNELVEVVSAFIQIDFEALFSHLLLLF
jgi:zinc finger CCCH domain-containing protein 13